MKIILLVMVIFVTALFLLAYLPVGMGYTGLRPRSHGCIGITVSGIYIHNILPDARIEVPPFSYFVDRENRSERNINYCLGKDIWYGE